MRLLGIGLGAALAALLLARSPLRPRIGNRLRALSDRAMLAFLRATSEFESNMP
jgi:hypothetical protein